MAKKTGKDGTVQISDTDVAEVISWEFTENLNEVSSSAMQDTFTENLPSIRSITGTITCNLDETDTTGQGVMGVGQVVAIKLFIEPDATGATYYGGNALITSISRSASVDAVIQQTFNFVHSDPQGITQQTVI